MTSSQNPNSAAQKRLGRKAGFLLVFLSLLFSGCKISTPKEKILKIFEELKTAAAKKDKKALYSLLSYSLKKKLEQKLNIVKAEFRKNPQKGHPFLKKLKIAPEEFQQWGGIDWVGFLLSRGDFAPFQKGKALRLAFSENNHLAYLLYQTPDNPPNKISLLKEGGEWKIENHALTAE